MTPVAADWDELVEAAPAGELYHTSSWLSVLEAGFGLETERIEIRRGGRLVAGLPVVLARRGPFLLAGSPLSTVATPQMGPLTTGDATEAEVLDAFDAFQKQRGVAVAELIYGRPEGTDELRARRYSVEDYLTYVVPLAGRSEADLWAGLKAPARTAIRKAQKQGVEVEVATAPAFLDQYLEMTAAVYGRQGRAAPIPRRFYEAMWRQFASDGTLRVLLASHRARLVAAAFFLAWKRRLYFQDGASLPEFQELRANNLLHWEAIRSAAAAGVREYDLVGAGNPSIARFKANFGGDLVRYPLARRPNGLCARLTLAAYRFALPPVRRLQRSIHHKGGFRQ